MLILHNASWYQSFKERALSMDYNLTIMFQFSSRNCTIEIALSMADILVIFREPDKGFNGSGLGSQEVRSLFEYSQCPRSRGDGEAILEMTSSGPSRWDHTRDRLSRSGWLRVRSSGNVFWWCCGPSARGKRVEGLVKSRGHEADLDYLDYGGRYQGMKTRLEQVRVVGSKECIIYW